MRIKTTINGEVESFSEEIGDGINDNSDANNATIQAIVAMESIIIKGSGVRSIFMEQIETEDGI
jgi:hypothetical protein